MPTATQIRDRLVGFRVTEHEHSLLRQVAANDERSVTGFLRHLLAETVRGFAATTPDRPVTKESHR